jgi:pyruvate formate lyase activating enzyme
VTSQAIRDPKAIAMPRETDPATLVSDALQLGATHIVSTYNEPLITSEWAVGSFARLAAMA